MDRDGRRMAPGPLDPRFQAQRAGKSVNSDRHRHGLGNAGAGEAEDGDTVFGGAQGGDAGMEFVLVQGRD